MSLTKISNKACDKPSNANIANVAKTDALNNKPCVIPNLKIKISRKTSANATNGRFSEFDRMLTWDRLFFRKGISARVASTPLMAPSMLGFKVSVIPLIAMMITACQSSPLPSIIGTQAGESIQNTAPLVRQQAQQIQAPTLAKKALVDALNRQRRRSYAYHIDALASNETYRSELAAATPQQLAMSDNVNSHCRHMHDTAYVDMLEQAEAEDKDIKDDDFTVQRQALKAAFLECQTSYDDWEMAQYYDGASFNLEDYLNLDDELMTIEDEGASAASADDDSNDDYPAANSEDPEIEVQQAIAAANEAEDDARLAAMIAESKAGEADESQSEFLPHYDSSHTRLDKRRATLLNDYLLEPLTVTSQGVYRPLSGQLSLSPNLQYNIRNLQVIGQHYIYVDAKEGAIYVWADTLAPMLSYYLDDKLGTQMHNKWLKLALNDGSLPDGFGRDVIASHFSAIDTVRANSAANEYGFISAATLLNTGAKPHSSHVPYLVAPKIIERRLDKQSMAKDLQAYRQTLYQKLTDKYPMLIEDDDTATRKVADIDGMVIISEDDTKAIDEIGMDVAMIEADADVNNNVVVVSTDATTITTTTKMSTINGRADSDVNIENKADSGLDSDIDSNIDTEVDSDIDTANDSPKSPTINSLLVMQKLLALIKIDDETDDSLDSMVTTAANNNDVSNENTDNNAKTPPIASKHPTIDYAAYTNNANLDKSSANSLWTLRDVYGLDNRQNIQWHLRQYQNPTRDMADTAKNDTLDHLTYETLTRYSAISPLTPMFATLPQDAAMPNTDNTIDFNSYSQDLMQRYENGEGPERGKMILKTIKEIGGGLIP